MFELRTCHLGPRSLLTGVYCFPAEDLKIAFKTLPSFRSQAPAVKDLYCGPEAPTLAFPAGCSSDQSSAHLVGIS